MEPYRRGEKLLSTSLDCFCGRRWQVFESARLLIQAPRYFFLQGSLFTRLDNRPLAANLLLTFWHKPRCFKCYQPYTLCYCQLWTWNLAAYHSLAPFLWYLIPARIHKRCCEIFISWAIWACKLDCLSGKIFKKDQKTWLPTCNFAWFWSTYYSARHCCLKHSFEAWQFYYGLAFKVFERAGGSASTRSSALGAWRIIFLQISILS